MLGLLVEFSLVVAIFIWLHRRQMRDRERDRRIPPSQLPLFEEDVDSSGNRAAKAGRVSPRRTRAGRIAHLKFPTQNS
jgi:hypothetical protein